jgi:plasmid stability protein
MPGLLIKDVPVELHKKLKESAARHRRSMTQQALALLEDGLRRTEPGGELPPLLTGSVPMTRALATRGRRQGQE